MGNGIHYRKQLTIYSIHTPIHPHVAVQQRDTIPTLKANKNYHQQKRAYAEHMLSVWKMKMKIYIIIYIIYRETK